jgi:hypothetical protein
MRRIIARRRPAVKWRANVSLGRIDGVWFDVVVPGCVSWRGGSAEKVVALSA